MGDLLIAAGIALTQLILAGYAVHVSVEKHRIRNAVVIGIVGTLGIALTIWATRRNDNAQAGLKQQLAEIQKNTETPPIVNVTVPTPPEKPKKSGGFLQLDKIDFREPILSENKPFSINIYLRNRGIEPLYHVHYYASVTLSNGAPTTHADSQAMDRKNDADFLKRAYQRTRHSSKDGGFGDRC